MYIIIGVLVAVAVGAIAFFLISKKKKAMSKDSEIESAAGEVAELAGDDLEEVEEVKEVETVAEVTEESSPDDIPPESERTDETITVSLESYIERLSAFKAQQMAALNAAMDDSNPKKREKLQAVVVSITRALTFPEQNLEREIQTRRDALAALKEMRDQEVLDSSEYDSAADGILTNSTEEAEQILDSVIKQNIPLSALASFHSASLAQCRMDFSRAMPRFDKAVELEKDNTDYLRSSGLLARRLYQHKKSLSRFMTLEKLLAEQKEDNLELALARRELAYSAALFGKNKEAGIYYKKSMGSIARLAGKDSPDMGICWFQIGELQESLGKYEQAEEPYKTALAIMDKAGDESVQADILDKLARLHVELEAEPEAIILFERLAGIMVKAPQPDQAGLIIVYNNLAEAYRICGKYDDSENYYKKALTLTQELRGPEHAAVASIYQELAKLAERQRKPEMVQQYSKQAAVIFDLILKAQEAEGESEDVLTL